MKRNPYRKILLATNGSESSKSAACSGNSDFAEKNDIDMIVMGTQGKAGIDRFLLGEVTEKVVRHSKAEVLVVRAPCP